MALCETRTSDNQFPLSNREAVHITCNIDFAGPIVWKKFYSAHRFLLELATAGWIDLAAYWEMRNLRHSRPLWISKTLLAINSDIALLRHLP